MGSDHWLWVERITCFVVIIKRQGCLCQKNQYICILNDIHLLFMKVMLLMVGKTDHAYWHQAMQVYQERLKHYLTFETTIIPDIKKTGQLSIAQQKELEGELIRKQLRPGDACVLLDEQGKQFTSGQFASYLEKKMHTVPKRLVFVIGGPYGFSQAVYTQVNERIALSQMTFSHQMIRPIFIEQLYRALTILRNEPYHHT